MSSSTCAKNSKIRAAVGNSESEGNSSISIRTVRSVSNTGYICPSPFMKLPLLELFLIVVFTCRCRNVFLHEFSISVHLILTSTWR